MRFHFLSLPRIMRGLASSAVLLLSGCVVAPVAEEYSYSTVGGTPVEVVEYTQLAPSPLHVWVGGQWQWGGSSYHWHPGYWAPPGLRPRPPHSYPMRPSPKPHHPHLRPPAHQPPPLAKPDVRPPVGHIRPRTSPPQVKPPSPPDKPPRHVQQDRLPQAGSAKSYRAPRGTFSAPQRAQHDSRRTHP